jgi:hypothetical protein
MRPGYVSAAGTGWGFPISIGWKPETHCAAASTALYGWVPLAPAIRRRFPKIAQASGMRGLSEYDREMRNAPVQSEGGNDEDRSDRW